MNFAKIYRKSLAGSFLALVFCIDLLATYQVFNSWHKPLIFGAILGITTLLTVSYHQRCLECIDCMAKAGKDIHTFYLLFSAVGIISLLVIFLPDSMVDGDETRAVLTLTYAALLLTAASIAFKAIIGVRQVFEQPAKTNSTTYGKAGYS